MLNLKKNIEKKTQKKTGISQYLDENSDDDDLFEDYDDEGDDDLFDDGNKNIGASKNPTKLIDLELVRLLKFCNDLKNKHKGTDAYQEEIMMKSLEIGKTDKEKTLILDMDECMIATSFKGKETKNF